MDKILSQRAKQFLLDSAHLNPELPELPELVDTKISISAKNDKILTVAYSTPSDELIHLALEATAQLCEGKSYQLFFSLTNREVESFLRDVNHAPALRSDSHEVFSQAFESVYKLYLKAIINDLGFLDLLHNGIPEDLLGAQKLAVELSHKMNSELSTILEFKAIFTDQALKIIYFDVHFLKPSSRLGDLEEVFNELLKEKGVPCSIKLVAV